MTLHEFYIDATKRMNKTNERYGQAIFNLLCEVNPKLAEKVRGTNMDPFYVTDYSNDERFQRFITFVEQNWSLLEYF